MAAYRQTARWGWIGYLTMLLVLVALFSLGVGGVHIPLKKVIFLLTHGRGTPDYTILFTVRLPRILLGLAVGGGLAIAGVVLQGMFRNPLVEPYTLGISGGAALGVALNIVVGGRAGLGLFSLPLSGFAGGVGVMAVVYLLSTRVAMLKLSRLLLIGVMASFITSSLIMLIMAMTRTEDLHGIIFWIMGSLQEPNIALIWVILAISLGGLLCALFYAADLNALSLGEEEAFHLGVKVERLKKVLFFLSSFVTGCCVSVSGIIGFVGLIVPHLLRLLVGGDHRILIITSYLAGAVFLILCDTLARVIMPPTELPVGVITGLLGGGVFIYALTRKGVSL
ncbi:MAG: iron ABC transporter permease [Deltaproteobacteria bacterium RBG_16_54_18]|nr:MAG: iron ABC transporter permease [Deltaproteobacteria bacterium RBG_16_54_18]